MTVSRKSKQVKNNATRKNEKSKRKTIKKYPKKSKNVTLKLRQSGGGPIEFIQWIFSKLLELFTFNRTNTNSIRKSNDRNTQLIVPDNERFIFVDSSRHASNNLLKFVNKENPRSKITVSRRHKVEH